MKVHGLFDNLIFRERLELQKLWWLFECPHGAFGNSLSLPQEFWETFRLDSLARVHKEQAPCKKRCDRSRCEKSEASLVHNDSKRNFKRPLLLLTAWPPIEVKASNEHRRSFVKQARSISPDRNPA